MSGSYSQHSVRTNLQSYVPVFIILLLVTTKLLDNLSSTTVKLLKIMENIRIFPEHSQVSSLIHHFINNPEDKSVEVFTRVAQQLSEDDQVKTGDDLEHLCRHVLESVAFYPAKPELLQSGLEMLGVSASLAMKLSSVWSQFAKKIVTVRRKVESELKKVDYQVMRDVQTQTQKINLFLTDVHDNTTMIVFSPSQLFSFYEQLECVQSSIDSICK